jgi:hypothetical protein
MREAIREEALISLAEYNKNSYSISDRDIPFSRNIRKKVLL